ncbi:MAG: hypothetical protein ACHQYP_05740 [Nitrospiria bacterium]
MSRLPGLKQFSLMVETRLVVLLGFGAILPLPAYDIIPVVHGGGIFGTIKLKRELSANFSGQVILNPEF